METSMTPFLNQGRYSTIHDGSTIHYAPQRAHLKHNRAGHVNTRHYYYHTEPSMESSLTAILEFIHVTGPAQGHNCPIHDGSAIQRKTTNKHVQLSTMTRRTKPNYSHSTKPESTTIEPSAVIHDA